MEQIKIILPEAVKRLSTFCKVPDMKHGRLAVVRDSIYCTANRMTEDITTSARPEQVKVLFHRTVDVPVFSMAQSCFDG